MKYIINSTYGGFTIPTEVMNYLNLNSQFDTIDDIRTDPILSIGFRITVPNWLSKAAKLTWLLWKFLTMPLIGA